MDTSHPMNLRRRILAAMAAPLAAAIAAPAVAQSFPDRPLRLIVPYPPGGATDILGRMIGRLMGEVLKQPVVVENRPGANGGIGVDAGAKAAPDGYTMVVGASTTHVLNPLLTKAPYDSLNDFTPLGLIASTPLFLVVNPSVPAKTLPELIAWLREQGGKASFGSYGNASASHLAGELFKSMAGVEMTHVPYKGGVPQMTDLIGGQIQVAFGDVSSIPHVQAGKVRAIGTTGTRRSSRLPDVPTVSEGGLQGYQVFGWFAVFGPAKLPDPVAARLRAALAEALDKPATQEQIVSMGLEPMRGTGDEITRLIRADSAKWSKVIVDAKIQVR
ncbi:MAG: Bug family tripartite tricarboxylate transporter substrate binding protein [Lautropia sp.]